jgi:hypothetical protein
LIDKIFHLRHFVITIPLDFFAYFVKDNQFLLFKVDIKSESFERKMIGNLWAMAAKEVGQENWNRLLRHLADIEEKTGQLLRRLPRGTDRQGRKDDETCPLLLFAPDRDREGRGFERVVSGGLLYKGISSDKKTRKYTIFSEDDAQWWQELTVWKKGVVISVLGYILRVLGNHGSMNEFIRKTKGELE